VADGPGWRWSGLPGCTDRGVCSQASPWLGAGNRLGLGPVRILPMSGPV